MARTNEPTLYKRPCTCPRRPDCPHPFYYKFTYKGTTYPGKSTGTSDRATAREIANKKHAEVVADHYGVRTPDQARASKARKAIRIDALIAEYHAEYAKDHPATADSTLQILERFADMLPKGKATPLHSITSKTIRDFKVARKDMPKARGGGLVSESNVDRELNAIRPMFRIGEARYDHPHPFRERWEGGRLVAEGVKLFNPDPGEAEIPSDDDIRKVFAASKGLPDPFDKVAAITYYTLARLREVAFLPVTHVSPGFIKRLLKGGRERTISVPHELTDALLARVKSESQMHIFPDLAARWVRTMNTKRGAKGTQKRGNPLSDLFGDHFKRIGVRTTHHKFRHLGVTHMLEQAKQDGGEDTTRLVMELAGWTTLRQLRRYGKVRDEALARAVARNAARLKGIIENKPPRTARKRTA